MSAFFKAETVVIEKASAAETKGLEAGRTERRGCIRADARSPHAQRQITANVTLHKIIEKVEVRVGLERRRDVDARRDDLAFQIGQIQSAEKLAARRGTGNLSRHSVIGAGKISCDAVLLNGAVESARGAGGNIVLLIVDDRTVAQRRHRGLGRGQARSQ